MESFTYNKIAGAFLGTCLVGMGLGLVANGIFSPSTPTKPGYALPEPKPDAAGGETKPVEVPLPVLLAKADGKKGEKDAQVCAACHNFAKGAGTKIGPDLYGVVDREKGAEAGFDYSKGLKDKGGKWTFADLNDWLTKPSAYIPGTKMGYPGEDSPEKRADIIAYLDSNASPPVPLPKVTAADTKAEPAKVAAAGTSAAPMAAGAAPAGGGDAALIKMIADSDPKKGEADAQICSACHNLKEGGGVIVGPPLWGVVDRDKGSVPGFDYSAGLKAKGGKWTYADLNTWLTKPAAYIPGTKMGYPGEASEKKRAEIIAYLRTLAKTPAPLMAAGGETPKPEPTSTAPAAAPAPPAAAPAPPAKPEQKTEAAPAEAKPMEAASGGPEPYEAVDPVSAPGPVAAASTTLSAPPSTVDLGAPSDADAAGPEPYAAPDAQETAKN